MKEIGETLKNAREEMGVSIEEAATDLKLKKSQLEDIEAGNIDAFKDVFYMKYFIRDYAKYLGLNYENMVDEFNEYLFDYTSKISIDDIRKAKKKAKKKKVDIEERKIASPYTIEKENRLNVPLIVLYILLLILIFIVSNLIFRSLDNKEYKTVSTISYNI